jgi:lipopolysaccharide transport system ATP-binding protein
MGIAVRIENISKEYHLGVINNGRLYRDMQSAWARMRGKEDPWSKIGEEGRFGRRGSFWALRDISFDVEQGQRVGIMGRNGAGKSTLLKILSRITAPTKGCIKMKGRLESLLEVGTGFHPELTGRENVYLNGAILGMKKAEIAKKFDEIVAFSEIEEFIDTPVKRYSSGMYVRLAFAVAAHLEAEILVADEVLAVGDAKFQAKCLGKMQDVSVNQGRTILFVSHSAGAVKQLCNVGVLLEQGTMLDMESDIESVTRKYTELIGL